MSALDRLRNHLWTSLALPLALGCGSRGGSDDEAGETTDPSESQTTDDDMGDDETDGEGSSDSSSDTEPDLCEVTFLGSGAAGLAQFPDCNLPIADRDRCFNEFMLYCVPAIGDQSCAEQCPDMLCAECGPVGNIGMCGPYEMDGQCCTVLSFEGDCGFTIDGRPFMIDGVVRFASLERVSAAGCVTDDPVRAHLAAHWARAARAEHASVASFAQFAAQLLVLGAPAELVRDALAAAGDEVRHAEAALALASELSGEVLELGVLDVRGAAGEAELEALVLACVREGCIGETLSALELGTAAEGCADPRLAALLQAIADDESRHAALAWRFVQWALGERPRLRAKVAELFEDLQPGVHVDEGFDREQRRRLRAQGCLPAMDRRRVEREGIRELIQPCAAALLGVDGVSRRFITNQMTPRP